MVDFVHYRAQDVQNKLLISGLTPLDIMVVGATGVGKSTTLNSLFSYEIAKVGTGVDPETYEITPFKLGNNIRLWDTPGLGDGTQEDKIHKRAIKRLLKHNVEVNGKIYGLIDLVILIIDSSSRDLSSSYTIVRKILKHIAPERVLIIVNQADFSMKGRNWDHKNHSPNELLLAHLREQSKSIKRRIFESTGLDVKLPIFYSAKENYNTTAVFDFIIENMPKAHRLRN